MRVSREAKPKCLVCSKEAARVGYKYCSNICQHEFKYQVFIEKWKSGKINGLLAIGIVSSHVKKYLRRKFNNKCYLCGWARVNPKTGLVPLVADHIDGDWKNNAENNLRLICPNCDSLLPTYAALNKGNGRQNRAISARVKEARMLQKV
jgi:hypothetical protein